MPAIYRKVKVLLTNNYYWSLDYLYVTRKQLAGALLRAKASHYRNEKTAHTPIILLPGIYETWQFMRPVADFLYARGYDIHVIEGLGYNHRSIEEMAAIVNSYIEQSDQREFILVAHSKGGLIGKYLLAHCNDHKNLRGLVALNTPFAGSWYAYFFLLFKPLRMFTPRSTILKYLAGNRSVNASIVSIYGMFDPHIPGGSKLDGAHNVQLPVYGHFRIMNSPLIHRAVLSGIERFQK